MHIALNRIILFVQDVDRLTGFYREAFGAPVLEETAGEWAVLRFGPCELALHRMGEAYRKPGVPGGDSQSNAKLVMTVDDLEALRTALIGKGARMGETKRFPGFPGPLCDGRDPEGNVFQLVQAER